MFRRQSAEDSFFDVIVSGSFEEFSRRSSFFHALCSVGRWFKPSCQVEDFYRFPELQNAEQNWRTHFSWKRFANKVRFRCLMDCFALSTIGKGLEHEGPVTRSRVKCTSKRLTTGQRRWKHATKMCLWPWLVTPCRKMSKNVSVKPLHFSWCLAPEWLRQLSPDKLHALANKVKNGQTGKAGARRQQMWENLKADLWVGRRSECKIGDRDAEWTRFKQTDRVMDPRNQPKNRQNMRTSETFQHPISRREPSPQWSSRNGGRHKLRCHELAVENGCRLRMNQEFEVENKFFWLQGEDEETLVLCFLHMQLQFSFAEIFWINSFLDVRFGISSFALNAQFGSFTSKRIAFWFVVERGTIIETCDKSTKLTANFFKGRNMHNWYLLKAFHIKGWISEY